MKHVDTPQTRCWVGVSRGDITPPVGIYHRMWGAASHDQATGVHRPLLATLLWLEPLARDPVRAQVIVALDHCILEGVEMNHIQQAIGKAASVQPHQVLISLSHTHGSGWLSRTRAHLPGGDRIGPYLDELPARMAALALDAKKNLEPATIAYTHGTCTLAAHRDYWDADLKQFVCGFNPGGPADDTVLVARITGPNDRTLATVVNYACHPTTLAWDNTAVSPDYVGAMREVIERVSGAPCLFLQGASGDLGPREGFVGDWDIADRNGRQLGYSVLSALEALPRAGTRFVYAGAVVSGTMIGTWRHEPLDPTTRANQEAWQIGQLTVELSYRHDLPSLEETTKAHEHWKKEEEKARAANDLARARDCRALVEQMNRQLARLNALPPGKTLPYGVRVLRLGDGVWIFVPGELYQVLQKTLRERFPTLPVVVATLTGNWQPGYLPAASSYGYGIYQDVIAAVAPGSLEVLIETITRKIRCMLAA